MVEFGVSGADADLRGGFSFHGFVVGSQPVLVTTRGWSAFVDQSADQFVGVDRQSSCVVVQSAHFATVASSRFCWSWRVVLEATPCVLPWETVV